MIESAMKHIEALSKPTILDIDGKKYTDKRVFIVADKKASAITLHTLTGLVDYIEAKFDDSAAGAMIVVKQHDYVELLSCLDPVDMNRSTFIACTAEECQFPFGRFMSVEDFIINLQANFEGTEDAAKLLQFVSTITVDAGATITDTGYSQEMTTKSGVRSEAAKIPNPVSLKPYRTFLDAEQPESSFVFRLKKGGEGAMPTCALFEADGGAWKNDAILNIRDFLKEKLPKKSVILA